MATSFPMRMLRASLLHADTYEEVEADTRSIRQATLVVVVAAISGGLGTWILHAGYRDLPASVAVFPLVLEIFEPFVLWVGGSLFCYMVGATFFRGPETETDFAEVLRTVGFAFAPAWFRVLGFSLPSLQAMLGLGDSMLPQIIFNLVLEAWVVLAGMIAVRQALDFTTARAMGSYFSAWVLLYLVLEGLTVTIESFL